MVVVRDLTIKDLDRASVHSEVEATISFIDQDGGKFVQIDTYGSKERAVPGKVSQSLRFSESAYQQLKILAEKHF